MKRRYNRASTLLDVASHCEYMHLNRVILHHCSLWSYYLVNRVALLRLHQPYHLFNQSITAGLYDFFFLLPLAVVLICSIADKMIGFTAYYRNGYTNGRVTFSNVIENYGGGFNKNTGTFTCPMSGLYIVSMTIQVEVDDSLNCWIYRNGHNTGIEVDIQGKGQEPATQTAFLRLYRGDALYITGCSSSNVGGETVFSAGLVQYG